jgi:microcystin-dependent protein
MDAYSPTPNGWLPCDGSAKDIAVFPALFAVIGNNYGSASPTFLVPNLLSRVIIGAYLIDRGAVGGAETVTLSSAETGNRGHRHYVNDFWTEGNTGAAGGNNATGGRNTVGHSRTTASLVAGSPGVGQSQTAHNNMQPYMRMQFIIKATL